MSNYANAKGAAGNSNRERDPRKENIPAMVQKELADGLGQPDGSAHSKSSASEVAPNHLGHGSSSSAAEDVQEQPGRSDKEAHPHPGFRSESGNTEAKLVDAVKALHVASPMPSLVVNGSGVGNTKAKAYGTEPFNEDLFHRTDSGSELGTKPPSLDGKSITSGTTFALDEKESLRPDDSASVKAAEDDDTFSGRGSVVAGGSRIGSEASRAYRAQFFEAPDRRSMQPMQERQSQGVNTPQSGSSSQQTTDDGKSKPLLVGAAGAPDGFSLFYRQTPDEKLLEALESPKDRIFLLRLEQDVIEFVKNSKYVLTPYISRFSYSITNFSLLHR